MCVTKGNKNCGLEKGMLKEERKAFSKAFFKVYKCVDIISGFTLDQ